MKTTKTLLALTLTLMLLLSIGTCAFAADYSATQKYLDSMTELDGAVCELQSDKLTIGGSTYEHVKVDYDGELSKYKSHFDICFTEDSSEILMSMTVMNYDAAKLADVLHFCSLLGQTVTLILP